MPARDAREAVDWLARRLGEDPQKYLGTKREDDDAKDEAAQILDELNRDNAVVLDGARTLILRAKIKSRRPRKLVVSSRMIWRQRNFLRQTCYAANTDFTWPF